MVNMIVYPELGIEALHLYVITTKKIARPPPPPPDLNKMAAALPVSRLYIIPWR